jgi:hypothetical protein
VPDDLPVRRAKGQSKDQGTGEGQMLSPASLSCGGEDRIKLNLLPPPEGPDDSLPCGDASYSFWRGYLR